MYGMLEESGSIPETSSIFARTIHFGLKHPEVGEKLRAYLRGLSL
jgi:hypothetical protein